MIDGVTRQIATVNGICDSTISLCAQFKEQDKTLTNQYVCKPACTSFNYTLPGNGEKLCVQTATCPAGYPVFHPNFTGTNN